MKLNFDNFKYYFQIPITWFKKINDICFNSYGGNCINISENKEGGYVIDVDPDQLASQITASLPPNILTQNDIGVIVAPNEYENTDYDFKGTITEALDDLFDTTPAIGDSLTTDSWVVTDSDGRLTTTTSQPVLSINKTLADDNGNIEIGLNFIKAVNGKPPDNDGNVEVGTIRTINNEAPDANGNIEIEAGGTVKSINDIEPDEDGNIKIDIVKSINGETPDEDGNIKIDIVKSVDGVTPDENGNVNLGAIVSINGYTADPNSGGVEIPIVESVEGITPDENGDISFGLKPNKWVSTDAYGMLTTTDTTPVTVEPTNKGYIYTENGEVTFKDEEYVKLTDDQQVAGVKTWQNLQTMKDGLRVDNGGIVVQTANESGTGADIIHDKINLNGTQPSISMSTAGSVNDLVIFKQASSGVIYDSTKILIQGRNGITLNTDSANGVKLAIQPSTDAGTAQPLAVATCGWVKDNTISIDKKTYTPQSVTKNVVTKVTWTGSKLTYDSESWQFVNGVLVKVTANSTATIDTPVTYSES